MVTTTYHWAYFLFKSVILNDLSDLEWLSEIFSETKHRAVSLRQLSFLFMLTWLYLQRVFNFHFYGNVIDRLWSFVWFQINTRKSMTTQIHCNTINYTELHCVPKKEATWCLIITLANVDRFSKFFHQLIREIIIHVLTAKISKISISPAICCYTTMWNSKIQKCNQIFTLNVTIINMFN